MTPDRGCCALLISVLLFAGCGKPNTPNAPAELRVGQFLFASASARVSLVGEDGDSSVLSLSYAELTDYRAFSPGSYTVDVHAGGQHLLHKTIGLGTGGRYSLLLAGIPQEGQEVNQATFGTRLHRIFEGAAARTDNDFLPTLLLQNDYFVPVPGEGNLRVTQLVPGLIPVDVELDREGDQQASLKGIAYAHTSDRDQFTAGTYAASLHLAGSPQDRLKFQLELDTSTFTNVYILPAAGDSRRLRVVTGRTSQ
ncbi:DUF4397 domain-containing protein [Lewinella sp. IMCC34191]|uniref:DUF4397 domain-containing protein n=1 Tax=Lewinella sp. IMCC34191 TaxID=2259172 RepID=UPI000E2865AA|nr:DUF4397 domain-containing protein [Lewinella sp. IMCC34191]